ncbi:hypothetical protein M413DRAFT_438877 [Hebeloma cylindrosporum]|uniref:Uncharacterized protein n=1 Tax=Hebeloma cylindrosporum TaxID=76867 RepID=A0A0C2YIZ3_HEBCY|nr:hypothetical protein M413DRAFT_438877 [Hebeloma cylindrosporum h7]
MDPIAEETVENSLLVPARNHRNDDKLRIQQRRITFPSHADTPRKMVFAISNWFLDR